MLPIVFAVHVPIAGLALLPLLLGLPILFGPMRIAPLEMVIDPVCSLVLTIVSLMFVNRVLSRMVESQAPIGGICHRGPKPDR